MRISKKLINAHQFVYSVNKMVMLFDDDSMSDYEGDPFTPDSKTSFGLNDVLQQ